MESTPLLQDPRTEERSRLGNLLKANVVFLTFHLAINIRNPVINQYLYQRYVRQLQTNQTDFESANLSKCFVNESDPAYITHVKAEEMSNNIQVIFSYINSSLSLFSCMFLGAYSDYIGRKILFIIPLLGMGARNALCTAVMYWNLDLDYMYIGEAITGITGGYDGSILASFVYSADNTPAKKSRTIGIAAVEFTTYFAAALSQAGTGYFINYVGFMYPSLVTAALMFLAVFMVVVMLPETVPVEKKLEPCITPTKAIKNVFGFYFSKDFGKKRSLFWMAVLAFFITYICSVGTANIDYMLMLNQPFCWGPEKIGFFNMASMLMKQFLGMGIIKLLHACTNDEVIAVFTTLIQAGGDVIHGLAYTDFMLYANIVAGGFGAASTTVIRSIMSRMAPGGIQGAMFAGLSVLAIISTAVGQSVFGTVYDATLETQRGFVYYASGATRCLGTGIMIVFLCVAPRILRQIKPETVVINESDWKPGPAAPKQENNTDSQV